jgi:hypothetical protein
MIAASVTQSRELVDYHRQISQALLGEGPNSRPPPIEINGSGYVIMLVNIDRARGQVRIEVTGGADQGTGTWTTAIPTGVPTDSYFFEDVPGASWGSWPEGDLARALFPLSLADCVIPRGDPQYHRSWPGLGNGDQGPSAPGRGVHCQPQSQHRSDHLCKISAQSWGWVPHLDVG